MVTGGMPDPQSRLTEVIDIVDPTRTCATLQEFPESMLYGMGGAIMNGSLIGCGDQYCYKYENDAWSQLGAKHTMGRDECINIVLKGKKNK